MYTYLPETTLVVGRVLHKPVREDPLALVSPQPDGGLFGVDRARRRLGRVCRCLFRIIACSQRTVLAGVIHPDRLISVASRQDYVYPRL